MSLIQLKGLNKIKKFKNYIIFLFLFLFFFQTLNSNEPIDIWKKKEEGPKINKIDNQLNNQIPEKKIDISKIKIEENEGIEILENKREESEIKLVGLFDPQKNDFKLDMWSNSDGEAIKKTFKRIEKIKLSKFSENFVALFNVQFLAIPELWQFSAITNSAGEIW